VPTSPRDVTDLDPTLLDRLLAGHASDAEVARLDLWLSASPELRAQIDELRHALAESPKIEPRSLSELRFRAAAIRRLADDHHSTRVRAIGRWPATGVSQASTNWRSAPAALAAVAVVAVVAMVGASLWRFGVPQQRPPQQFREFTTTAGNRASVVLRDGTRLVLGPATRVRVPAEFGLQTRTVDLDGEAYFAVVHDARLPFTVRAGNAITTDVGTMFDVRAYVSDPAVRVAVAEGSVVVRSTSALRSDAEPSSLTVGDVAVVSATGAPRVTHHADVASLTAWRDGQLVFRRTPLAEALVELSRWYGVTISAPGIETRQITATVDQRTVTAALDMLAPAVGARYSLAGDAIVLTPLSVHP
jgi:transmembrane sensor